MSAGTPPLSGPPKPQSKALNCPKCGAAIVLRSFGQAVTVVCSSCRSILDAKDPNLAILQQFELKTSDVKPLIPRGTRGKLRGTDYEVIGFQRRSAVVDRSEERRVGKECRTGWWGRNEKKRRKRNIQRNCERV